MSIFSKLKLKKKEKEKSVKKEAVDLGLDKKKETKKQIKKQKEVEPEKVVDKLVKKEVKKKVVKKVEPKEPKKDKEPVKKKIDRKDRKKYSFAHQVLIKPLVTEKSSSLGMYNQYVFEVAKQANKVEIKKAIQAVYGVEPVKVRVISMGGKQVRYGRRRGQTRAWKKAIITLRAGDKIEVYEGV